MKVHLLIQNNPFAQNSASANRYLSLLQGLTNNGVEILLYIYGGFGSESEKIRWGGAGKYTNIYYEYLNTNLVVGYFSVRYNMYFDAISQLKKVLRVMNFKKLPSDEIIWTDKSYLCLKFTVLYKKLNPHAKLFIEISEFLDIHHFNRGNIFQRLHGDLVKRFFEKEVYFVYNGIALMTQTLINHFESFPKPLPKLIHLPMTVDLERFKVQLLPPHEFKSPYIAFVGVMNDAKDGVSILINAFNQLKDRFPSYRLYLVGPWNYDTPTHLKLIKERGLEGRVFWMKEYKRDLIPSVLSNADLLVLPRPDSKQAQGGFPTKLGEYLATGNPVCATRVGEIPDYLTDNESVFFADPGSVESFAEAMNRALNDPENAKRVGANGRKVAEQEFNKEIQSKKLYDFFQQLIAS